MHKIINRRLAIKLTCLPILMVLGAFLSKKLGLFPASQEKRLNSLLQHLSQNKYALLLGQKFLDAHNEDATQLKLFFFERLKVINALIGSEIYSQLKDADFQTGRVVSVNGWIVSESEAKAYALLNLKKDKS